MQRFNTYRLGGSARSPLVNEAAYTAFAASTSFATDMMDITDQYIKLGDKTGIKGLALHSYILLNG